MTREIAGVQNPTVAYAKARGWVAWKMMIEGRNGCPDYWLFKHGVVLIIEFKSPTGKRTKQQELRARDLEGAGFKVHVVSSFEQGKNLVDRFDAFAEDGLL